MIAYLEKKTTGFLIRESKKLHFPAHLHPHIEFVILLDARATAYADTECCVLQPGDAFIAFPNQVHRYDPPCEGERSIIVIVDPDMVPELCATFFDVLPRSAHLKAFLCDEVQALCARLSELMVVSSPLEEIERRALLTALFSRVLSAARPMARENAANAVGTVVNYCAQHYTEDLSLETLERELHISRYYISHMFTQKLRIGFNDYVNSLRVSHACRYLQNEDRPITEISTLVGFSGPRTFNRAFAKCIGMTPSEYRKQNKT